MNWLKRKLARGKVYRQIQYHMDCFSFWAAKSKSIQFSTNLDYSRYELLSFIHFKAANKLWSIYGKL